MLCLCATEKAKAYDFPLCFASGSTTDALLVIQTDLCFSFFCTQKHLYDQPLSAPLGVPLCFASLSVCLTLAMRASPARASISIRWSSIPTWTIRPHRPSTNRLPPALPPATITIRSRTPPPRCIPERGWGRGRCRRGSDAASGGEGQGDRRRASVAAASVGKSRGRRWSPWGWRSRGGGGVAMGLDEQGSGTLPN